MAYLAEIFRSVAFRDMAVKTFVRRREPYGLQMQIEHMHRPAGHLHIVAAHIELIAVGVMKRHFCERIF